MVQPDPMEAFRVQERIAKSLEEIVSILSRIEVILRIPHTGEEVPPPDEALPGITINEKTLEAFGLPIPRKEEQRQD